MLLDGSEARSGYATHHLATGETNKSWERLLLPCAAIAMPGANFPAVVMRDGGAEEAASLWASVEAECGRYGAQSVVVHNTPSTGSWVDHVEALRHLSYDPLWQPPEAVLTLEPQRGFLGYVAGLRYQGRKLVRRERRTFLEAATVTDQPPSRLLSDEVLRALELRYRKYGHATSLAAVRDRMERVQQLPGLRVRIATLGDDFLGFSATVADRLTGVLTVRLAGWVPNDCFAYFNLCYYDPVAQACDLGLHEVHVGTETYLAKVRRGWGFSSRTAHVKPLVDVGSDFSQEVEALSSGLESRFRDSW